MWRVTEAVSVYGHGHDGSKGEGTSWYVVQTNSVFSRLSSCQVRRQGGDERHDDFDEIADYHVDPTEYIE